MSLVLKWIICNEQVALLCTRSPPSARPAMSEVVRMLLGGTSWMSIGQNAKPW